MAVSAMTLLVSFFLLLVSAASKLASLVLEGTRLVFLATVLALKLSLRLIRPIAAVFYLLWLVDFLLRLLNAAEALPRRTQRKGCPAADSLPVHERFHRMMCGQQCRQSGLYLPENSGATEAAAAPARESSIAVGKPSGEVPQQAQAVTEPAAAAAPKVTGNSRRRLLLGESSGCCGGCDWRRGLRRRPSLLL